MAFPFGILHLRVLTKKRIDMEFPNINEIRERLSKAVLSGEAEVVVTASDLSMFLLYLAMAEPGSTDSLPLDPKMLFKS